MGAVIGLRAFLFVTAVDFTCTNLVQHYVIVEMEEVRIKRKARHINNQATLLKHNKHTLFKIVIFYCKFVRRRKAQCTPTFNFQPDLFISTANYSTNSIPSTTVVSPTPGIVMFLSVCFCSLARTALGLKRIECT